MLALARKEDDWPNSGPGSIGSVGSGSSGSSGASSREPRSSLRNFASSIPMSNIPNSSNTQNPPNAALPSPSRAVPRSKSRGPGSVGGFVNGIVNGVHASMNGLRNVGGYASHRGSQSVPSHDYHSDRPPSSGLFKSKTLSYRTKSPSPSSQDIPSSKLRERERRGPMMRDDLTTNGSATRFRAYESDNEKSTFDTVRRSKSIGRPQSNIPFESLPSDERGRNQRDFPNGLSPMSTPISPTSSTASSSSAEELTSPPWSPTAHIVTGQVSQSAARAVLELDAIPPTELLKVLAALLEQIAAANDLLRADRAAQRGDTWVDDKHPTNDDDLWDQTKMPLTPESPSAASQSGSGRVTAPSNTPIWDHLTTASRIALSSRSATLSFHARHVPQISLEAYLLRILKYCPTTNATFVAILVYFDRMCRIAGSIESERLAVQNDQASGGASNGTAKRKDKARPAFAIDSYNVHRLVIAGVTVSSKFFSDVFYTNSRYAKVGGLPQGELNQLELQFLLLNDFTLVIPPEELAKYAAQLIAYAQGRGIDLTPEGLGKGKLGREAKVVLGLEVPVPEVAHFPLPDSPPPSTFRQQVPYYGHSDYGRPGHPVSSASTSSLWDSSTIGHDSEAEVSTDEDSTIRAQSGSESERSLDGGDTETETETEGELDDDSSIISGSGFGGAPGMRRR